MRLCFPVEQNLGLKSRIYYHFGSAPLYLLIDTETEDIQELPWLAKEEVPCTQARFMREQQVEALVLSGVGEKALTRLVDFGIQVYEAKGVTIADNLICLSDNRLHHYEPEQACPAYRSEATERTHHHCTH